MSGFSKSFIAKVENNANIVNIIGNNLQLHKTGVNYFAHCPFHTDRTPSFCVSPAKQIFTCFSCGRSGDVFTFLMDYRNMSFPQAVAAVAHAESINVPHLNNKGRKFYLSKRYNSIQLKMIKLYRITNRIYSYILLNTKAGEPALNYLHKRGISDQAIKDYGIGYSPNTHVVASIDSNKGYSEKFLAKSGVIFKGKYGLYDRMSRRITFPIRDTYGHIVGFSGRVLNKKLSPAKYLNSAETSLFKKGKIIYNLSKARPSINKKHKVVLCEGFMDVISAYESHVTNVVASLGTALTSDQADHLAHVADEVVICYDGDAAGQKAIDRAIAMFSKTSLKISVIKMPNGLDPDDFRRKYDGNALRKYMATHQESATEFKLHYDYSRVKPDNADGQAEYLKLAARDIALAPQSINRSVYISRIARFFKIPAASFDRQVRVNAQGLDHEKKHFSYQSRRKYFRNKKSSRSYGYGRYRRNRGMPRSKMMNAQLLLLHAAAVNDVVRRSLNTMIRKNKITFLPIGYETLFYIIDAYATATVRRTKHGLVSFAKHAHLSSLAWNVVNYQLPKQNRFKKSVNDCIILMMSQRRIQKQEQRLHQALVQASNSHDGPRVRRLLDRAVELARREQKNRK